MNLSVRVHFSETHTCDLERDVIYEVTEGYVRPRMEVVE